MRGTKQLVLKDLQLHLGKVNYFYAFKKLFLERQKEAIQVRKKCSLIAKLSF